MSTSSKENKPSGHLITAHLLQMATMLLVIGSVLFIAAGRLDWWEAWTFLIIYFLISLLTAVWMLYTNPELVQERDQPGKNVKPWDRRLIGASLLLTLALFAVTGLDAGRWGYSKMPLSMKAMGLLGFIPAFGLPLWASKINTYLSSRVRIQEERGHEVVAEGPYRYVRHPMYAGMIFYDVSVPLWLGSWLGVGVAAIMTGLVITRTVLEDNVLQKELPGYEEYSRQVRYRLFPGIW